jgi:hypothetical protein
MMVDMLIPKQDPNQQRPIVAPIQAMVVNGDRCGKQVRKRNEKKKEDVKLEYRTDKAHGTGFQPRVLKPTTLPEGGTVNSFLKLAIRDSEVSFEPDVFLMSEQMRSGMESRYQNINVNWPMAETKRANQGDTLHMERTESGNLWTKTANRALFGADAVRKKDEEVAWQMLMDIYMSAADAAAEIEARKAATLSGSNNAFVARHGEDAFVPESVRDATTAFTKDQKIEGP